MYNLFHKYVIGYLLIFSVLYSNLQAFNWRQAKPDGLPVSVKWFCSQKKIFYELINKVSNWQIVALTKTLYPKLLWKFIIISSALTDTELTGNRADWLSFHTELSDYKLGCLGVRERERGDKHTNKLMYWVALSATNKFLADFAGLLYLLYSRDQFSIDDKARPVVSSTRGPRPCSRPTQSIWFGFWAALMSPVWTLKLLLVTLENLFGYLNGHIATFFVSLWTFRCLVDT